MILLFNRRRALTKVFERARPSLVAFAVFYESFWSFSTRARVCPSCNGLSRGVHGAPLLTISGGCARQTEAKPNLNRYGPRPPPSSAHFPREERHLWWIHLCFSFVLFFLQVFFFPLEYLTYNIEGCKHNLGPWLRALLAKAILESSTLTECRGKRRNEGKSRWSSTRRRDGENVFIVYLKKKKNDQ